MMGLVNIGRQNREESKAEESGQWKIKNQQRHLPTPFIQNRLPYNLPIFFFLFVPSFPAKKRERNQFRVLQI